MLNANPNAARIAAAMLDAKLRVFASMRAEYDPACIERFANYENEMPDHVFKYEDAMLGRRHLNKLFGFKKARPARECEALESFLDNMLTGCGYEMSGMSDVVQFMVEMNIKALDLQFLWIECGRRGYKDGHGYWPVVEKKLGHEGVWRLAWFVNGIRQTQWQEYTKDADLLETTPAFEGAEDIKEVE